MCNSSTWFFKLWLFNGSFAAANTARAKSSRSSLSMAACVDLSRIKNVSLIWIAITVGCCKFVVCCFSWSNNDGLTEVRSVVVVSLSGVVLTSLRTRGEACNSTTEQPILAIVAVILASTPSTSGPRTMTVVYPGCISLSTSTSNSNSCPSSKAWSFNRDAFVSSTNNKLTKPNTHPIVTPTIPPVNPVIREALMPFCALVILVEPLIRLNAESNTSPNMTPPMPEKTWPIPAAARVDKLKVTPSVQST